MRHNCPNLDWLPHDAELRKMLLKAYWEELDLDLLVIHLQGLKELAARQGRKYPYRRRDARDCEQIYRRRTGDLKGTDEPDLLPPVVKNRILFLTQGGDIYQAAQISALCRGFDEGLRAYSDPVNPFSMTETAGWEWDFGCKEGLKTRARLGHAMPCRQKPHERMAVIGTEEWFEIDIEKTDGSGEYTTFASIFENLNDAEAAAKTRQQWSNRKMRIVRVSRVRHLSSRVTMTDQTIAETAHSQHS